MIDPAKVTRLALQNAASIVSLMLTTKVLIAEFSGEEKMAATAAGRGGGMGGSYVFWEQVGALGPVYRLVGQGFSDRDIATKLDLTELRVQSCIAWLLHFLKLSDRYELIRYAATPTAM